MPNNIGVVGDRESVLAFRMLGFDVHFATEAKEARRIIDKLAEKNYGVVYLTEQLAESIPESIRQI